MGHNLSKLNDSQYFNPFATPHLCRADAGQVVTPALRSKSTRPEGPSGLKALKQKDKARATSPTGSVRSNTGTDSLHRVWAGPGDDRKPSKNYEDPERRLQLWVEGGVDTEKRQEAVDRIKQAKMKRMAVTDLTGLGLKSLPSQIAMLNETKALWLSNNDLNRLPPDIERLASLQVLEVVNNRLGFGSKLKGVPQQIGKLTNLRILNLSHNKLSTLPGSIGNINTLKELDISENQLETLPPELANISELKRISAHHNQLSQVPGAMGAMTQLRSVDLSNNQLWNLPDAWGRLAEAKTSLSERLRELNLSDNRLQQLPASFGKPQKKLILNVANNPMESLPANYGGFSYADLTLKNDPDQTLTNHDNSVRVYTRDTKVRQGLVNEGRLAAGRGVFAFGPLMRAQERRPPKPLDYDDRDSIYSIEDFIEEHREGGGIQNIGIVGAHAGIPMAIPKVPPEWAVQRANDWIGVQAEEYAYRNLPEAPMPPMQTAPQWDSALPSMFRTVPQAAPPIPSFAAPQPQQSALRPEFLETMFAQLQQLPQPVQTSIQAYLENLPPHQLVMELLQMQDTSAQFRYGQSVDTPVPPGSCTAPQNPLGVLAQDRPGWDGGTNPFGSKNPEGGEAGPSTGHGFNPRTASSKWSAPPPWAKKPAEPENEGLFGRFKSVLEALELA